MKAGKNIFGILTMNFQIVQQHKASTLKYFLFALQNPNMLMVKAIRNMCNCIKFTLPSDYFSAAVTLWPAYLVKLWRAESSWEAQTRPSQRDLEPQLHQKCTIMSPTTFSRLLPLRLQTSPQKQT